VSYHWIKVLWLFFFRKRRILASKHAKKFSITEEIRLGNQDIGVALGPPRMPWKLAVV